MSYHVVLARAGRQGHDPVFSLAERLQTFLISVISPDNSPKPQPCIIYAAKIVQIISRLIGVFDVKVECL